MGKHIVKELLKGGKHEVTAVTRGEPELPNGVKVAKVSYDDPASLTTALEGQDVLIVSPLESFIPFGMSQSPKLPSREFSAPATLACSRNPE